LLEILQVWGLSVHEKQAGAFEGGVLAKAPMHSP